MRIKICFHCIPFISWGVMNKTILPPYLKSGDKAGIVSTAKRVTEQDIEHGLTIIKSWGLEPVLGRHAFNENFFLAGTDDERAEDLQQMLDDPEIKVILFTRGGYGTLRIIDSLDFTAFIQNPKWIAGFSDITVLHSHINALGIATIHSIMLAGMASCNKNAVESLRKALFGESLEYIIPNEIDNKNIPDRLTGEIVGGNLSILYSLIGSGSDCDTDGKILFIEDIDEYLYHFDRMFLSLKRAGKLAKLKGLITGNMTDIKESTIPFGPSVREMVAMQTKEYKYPIYFGFPAGHSNNNNAIIFGKEIQIFNLNNNTAFKII